MDFVYRFQAKEKEEKVEFCFQTTDVKMVKGNDLIKLGITNKNFPVDNKCKEESRLLMLCEEVVAQAQQQKFKQPGEM
jgi:hypothetical protein